MAERPTQRDKSVSHKVLLIGGPDNGETITVEHLGPCLVSPFGRDGEVVYRVHREAEPLSAEFEGFRQR